MTKEIPDKNVIDGFEYGVSNAGTANSSEDNRIYGNGNSDILGNTLIGVSPQ